MSKGARLTLEDISRMPARNQAEVAKQLGDPYAVRGDPYHAPGLSIKQRKGKVSKLQADFVAFLRRGITDGSSTVILEEAITLEIANGCRYRPDAWTIIPTLYGDPVRPLVVNAWEVKGPHAWDDSIVKLKVAARAFRWINFHLVTREGRFGAWKIEPVLA